MKRGGLLLAALSLAAVGALLWLWSGSPRAARDYGDEEPANFGDSAVHGARPAPPLQEIRFEEGGPEVSFFALGDTGWSGPALRANVAAMRRAAAATPVDFVLLLGDNFYPAGVRSLDDPLWKVCFEEPFAGFEVPFHVLLGNHDHRGNVEAQLAYSGRDARWRMPARWYAFTVPLRGGEQVQFFAVDTQPMRYGWLESAAQEAWLAGELERSKARWKIVLGHHPVLSHGLHGPTPRLGESLAPLLERAGVDLYVSGHDHDLQLLRSKAGWLQLVSGAGCSTRETAWGDDTLFAAASPGFAWVGISRTEMWIEIATASQGPLFRIRVEKP